MPPPTIIQGPACVSWNSYDFYTQGNVTIHYRYETWNPNTAAYGKLGERFKSKVAEVRFTPAGMYTPASAVKYWPNSQADAGKSLFGSVPASVVIAPLTGNKVTFVRGGVSQWPALKLSPLSTVWQEMSFLCVGDAALDPTNAAYVQSIAATAFPATFDETKVISPRYTASFTGADGAAQSGVEPDDEGFMVEPIFETRALSLANFGLVDAIITSIGWRARFKPLSLTEAQIAAALGLQNTTAVQPGDAIGRSTDLVIAGASLTWTGKRAGLTDAALAYGPGQWRQGEVAFVGKSLFTSGVPQALWVFA
jgi:hypothetical protein